MLPPHPWRLPHGAAPEGDGYETIEPDLPRAVSVLEEEDGSAGALWITGGVPVLRGWRPATG